MTIHESIETREMFSRSNQSEEWIETPAVKDIRFPEIGKSVYRWVYEIVHDEIVSVNSQNRGVVVIARLWVPSDRYFLSALAIRGCYIRSLNPDSLLNRGDRTVEQFQPKVFWICLVKAENAPQT